MSKKENTTSEPTTASTMTAENYGKSCGATQNQLYVLRKMYKGQLKTSSDWKKIFEKTHTNIKAR